MLRAPRSALYFASDINPKAATCARQTMIHNRVRILTSHYPHLLDGRIVLFGLIGAIWRCGTHRFDVSIYSTLNWQSGMST
jgi:tRNA G37 N-methylase Trm5